MVSPAVPANWALSKLNLKPSQRRFKVPSKTWSNYNQKYVDSVVDNHLGGHTVTSFLHNSGSKSKVWDNTANFFSKVRAKDHLSTQRFTLVETQFNRPVGELTYYPTSNPSSWVRNTGALKEDYCSFDPLPVWGVDNYPDRLALQDRLNSNLLKKIKSSSVNLAQAFAERKQTADLLASTAGRLAKSYSLLRRGDIFGASNQLFGGAPTSKVLRRFHKDRHRPSDVRAANSWLELQYGWVPLLSDVYGSAEALARANNRRREYSVSSAMQSNMITTSKRYAGHGNGIEITDELFALYKEKRKITYRIDNLAAKTIAETGISNPALLSWELLPYSFVVDWFLPIGSYLENIDATAGCTFLRGSISYRYNELRTAVGRGIQNTGIDGNWTYSGLGSGSRKYVAVHRNSLAAFPSNPLPTLKNPLSLTHVANAISLLTTAFRR